MTQLRTVPEMPNHDDREAFEKNRMINGIKCSREIKKTEARNLLLAIGTDELVMNGKKSSFSRMEFGIGRLK